MPFLNEIYLRLIRQKENKKCSSSPQPEYYIGQKRVIWIHQPPGTSQTLKDVSEVNVCDDDNALHGL